MRQLDRDLRTATAQLDRSDCFETWLFSRTLRRTRQCVDMANRTEDLRRKLSDLDIQRQQLMGGQGTRSMQDEIIRELARNNCGPNYQQEARRRGDSFNPFSSLWQDEDSGPGARPPTNQFGALPYATYRTLCVRLCDGYYFPVSFATLPNHFPRDAEVCQSKCAAPAELYYHQNPGGAVEQMVSVSEQKPYTSLRNAFRNRKEYVAGCSCKQAEYKPSPNCRAKRRPRRRCRAPLPAAAGANQRRLESSSTPERPRPLFPGTALRCAPTAPLAHKSFADRGLGPTLGCGSSRRPPTLSLMTETTVAILRQSRVDCLFLRTGVVP